jgi:hypothetical protein
MSPAEIDRPIEGLGVTMKHRRAPRSYSLSQHLILALLGAVFVLLLVTPVALAAPPVDGWQMTSVSEDVGQSVHARMDAGHAVWVDGRSSGATPIVLLDISTGQTQVIAADGSSPEIDGDHVVYFGPHGSSTSDGGDVLLYTISTGETTRVTSDLATHFNYGLRVKGSMVTWLSATRVGIEGPLAGDISLLLHDIAKNKTVTLAAGEPGTGGPGGDYVIDAEKVIWTTMPAYALGGQDSEVWLYSATTGETGKVFSLRNYNLVALAGNTLVAYRQWGSEGGVQHFVSYDLQSKVTGPLDGVPSGTSPGALAADGHTIAWAGYADGSTYVALSDLAGGQTKHILTTGYDVGGLALRGKLLIWHGQFRGRYAGTNWNYLFVYDIARDTVTRLSTLAGSNDSYGADDTDVAFTTGNSWPYRWNDAQQLLLASSISSLTPAFLDVPGTHLYRTAIQGLKERQIVNGYPWADGIGTATGVVFRPAATLTRAQFAKMLALALGIPIDPAAAASFDDVPPGLYPGAYVAALAERGIAQGTGPRVFSPDASVSRAQLMTLLVRGIDKVKPGVLGTPPLTNYPQGYPGALGSFDPMHAPFMLRAELNGLVDGLVGYGFGGKWDPWKPATRAEAAQALWNYLGKEGRPAPSIP